jgi:DNA-binding protein HU-beta
MNRAKVISKIRNLTGIQEEDVKVVVETFLHVIQQALIAGEEVHIKGFGKFFNKKRSSKIARNLSNNTALLIGAHYIPTLKLSKDFVNKIKKIVPI